MKQLLVDNTVLIKDKKATHLSSDVASGASSISVQSIIGFNSLTTSSGQILLIGELGQEKSEIIKTSSATGPSGSTVTLATNTVFDHPQDTKIYILDWDRVEFQHASSVSGAKSTILAYPISIQPDQKETLLVDSSQTSGFYFARFNETVGNTSSSWSDPIPYTGYDDNSVHEIKRRALESIGEEIDTNLITDDFLNKALWEARREYHQAPGKRPFRRKYNVAIGTALTGSYRIDLPTDVEKPYGADNVYGVRIGSNNNMNYIDKKAFDSYYINKPHSTLDLPYVVGLSTSIWLTNGKDFSNSATINVEGTNIGLSRISGSNNSFTIYSHGDWSCSAGSDAWENASFGLPDKFTVWADPGGSAYIYFNRPIDTAYINMNIYADYYRTLVGYDSDYDTLDEPDYDMYVPYLASRIKHKKSRGAINLLEDSDYKVWLFKKLNSLGNERLSTDINLSPDIDALPD